MSHETPVTIPLGRLRAKHREKVEDAAQAAMPTVLKRLRIFVMDSGVALVEGTADKGSGRAAGHGGRCEERRDDLVAEQEQSGHRA